MAYQATGTLSAQRERENDDHVLLKLFALFAGLAVGALIPLVIWLGASAQSARDDANAAAARVATTSSTAMPGTVDATTARATPSFAGTAPADADALAMAHRAVPAALPAAPVGPVAHVALAIEHATISIAPGIRYEAWTFGSTAPGPAIHVRQGQRVVVTLRNDSPMAHSVDFHAAQVAPNVAFADVLPGKSKTYSFVASAPGVFMYHCGTAPAFVHIANGMYGAIVVEPRGLPPVQKQYVLVASEWYLNGPGDRAPAALDMAKANAMTPDWVTWNGYAHQYKDHPLTAEPGDTVRFWVVDAGPSLNTESVSFRRAQCRRVGCASHRGRR